MTHSWGRFSSVVEAVSSAWLCGFKSAGKGLQFCFEKRHEFRRDRATIAPRSGPNLRRGRLSVVVRSSGGDSAAEGARSWFDRAAIAVRSRCDRGSIALRSRFDRATIEPFFHLYSLPSDEDLIVMTIPTVRWRSDISDASTRCFGSRKIPTVHAASNACKKNQ